MGSAGVQTPKRERPLHHGRLRAGAQHMATIQTKESRILGFQALGFGVYDCFVFGLQGFRVWGF